MLPFSNGSLNLEMLIRSFMTVTKGILQALVIAMTGLQAYGQQLANDWKTESQREGLSPETLVDAAVTFEGKPTLVLKGGGKDHAAGMWYKVVAVQPGTWYNFRTWFKPERVDEPDRSIIARVIWQDEKNVVLDFREYPAKREQSMNGWQLIEQAYQAPPAAKTARLELHYRWDSDGVVHFGGTTFEKTDAPRPRMVRLATVHHKPHNSKSIEENLGVFAALAAEAGALKADIVCLPEAATIAGTRVGYVDGGEPVPGPTTKQLGEVARKHNMYIVVGLMEREGDIVYNTAVLIDRKGNVAGKYRKTSLPREEIDGGLTPGNSFPVFDTDFGRIGMMICWDSSFPEPAAALARQGAEVILMPIAGGYLTLVKARALENQVYVVSSTYDMISAVFDHEGNVVKEATRDKEVIVVDVDLNARKLWPWIGDFKNRIQQERPSQKAAYSYQKTTADQ